MARATVTVGLRLPNGLQLRIGSDLVVVNGTHFPGMNELDPSTSAKRAPPWRIVHGFALTPGVDAEGWERWLAENHDAEIVLRELIWASADDPDGEAIRRARGQRSGLEQTPQPTAGQGPDPGTAMRRSSSFRS